MARGGGSAQPGLPADYGSGGVASSGRGTVRGHTVARTPANTSGMSNDPMHDAGGGNTAPVSTMMNPDQVRSMQQFLTNHGFQVAQDGVMGPLTKSAAAAFRANHKGGDAWNKAHGIGVHPSTRAPHDMPAGAAPTGHTPAARTAASAGGGGSGDALQQLLTSLLGGGGNVGVGYDAQSFGDAAAAPDTAQALALSRQIGANPKQEAQSQADISNWYGLDPKAKSYQLSVLGRLAQARGLDAQAATDAQGNMGDLAQALAGSIGGSANDGSSSVLAAGANAAGTMGALGEAQKQYADQMDPLLRAEAVGNASREKAANSQTLLDLQDKMALAQGQARADRAQGAMGAQDKNNALGQQRFANQGNLLSILAQMQAADPNTPVNAATLAKIKAQTGQATAASALAKARATHLLTDPGSTKAPLKYDLQAAANRTAGLLGIGADAGGQLPPGTSVTKLAYTLGSVLEGMGLKKGTPDYQRAGQTLISMFKDPQGNPIQAPPTWFGPNS